MKDLAYSQDQSGGHTGLFPWLVASAQKIPVFPIKMRANSWVLDSRLLGAKILEKAISNPRIERSLFYLYHKTLTDDLDTKNEI